MILENDMKLSNSQELKYKIIELQNLIERMKCCQNCKHNHFGHKCSKGQTKECINYNLWEIHDYDCVEM